MQEKYGVVNVFQCEEIKSKIRQTMLDRYGISCALSAGPIRNKGLDVIKKKYGVSNAWLIHQRSGAISSINRDFGKRLSDLGYCIQYEYNLGDFSYDLLINNKIILEINPTVTHNEDISFQYLRKYTTDNFPVNHRHLERYMLARNFGKIPIFYFDWMSKDVVINYIDFLLRAGHRKTVDFDKIFRTKSLNGNTIILEPANFDYQAYSMADLLEAFNLYKQDKSEIMIELDMASGLFEIFERLGFKQISVSEPLEHYCKIDGRICRDPTTSVELQNEYRELGLVRVLDCGREIYAWRN